MLKRIIGVSSLLCGLLMVSSAVARPHPTPGKDAFDKVGRPDESSVRQFNREEPRTQQKTAGKLAPATHKAPATFDKRRQRGELYDSAPTANQSRAALQASRTGQRAGKSPGDKRGEQVANCSEFNQCSVGATNNAKSGKSDVWIKRQWPREVPPAKPVKWDHGKIGAAYGDRIHQIEMLVLGKGFMPELGDDCRNGTDCWLP